MNIFKEIAIIYAHKEGILMKDEYFYSSLRDYSNVFKNYFPIIYNELYDILNIHDEMPLEKPREVPLRKVSHEQVIAYVREFLHSISPEYEETFNQMVEKDIHIVTEAELENRIQNQDFSQDQLELWLEAKDIYYPNNGFLGFNIGSYYDGNIEDVYSIFVFSNESIRDCFTLIHELTHYIAGWLKTDCESSEIQPILSEFLFANFMLKNHPEYEDEINYIMNDRIYEFHKTFAELYHYYDVIDIYEEKGEVTKEDLSLDEAEFDKFKDDIDDNVINKQIIYNWALGRVLKMIDVLPEEELTNAYLRLNDFFTLNDENDYLDVVDLIMESPRKNKQYVKSIKEIYSNDR